MHCYYIHFVQVCDGFFHSIHVNFALWISWLLDWNLRLKVVAWWKLLACNFCMGPLWLIVYILLKRRSSESPFQYGFQYSTKVLWCRRALAILSKKLFPRGLCQQCIGPHCSSHTWPKIAAMGTSSRWKAASSSFQANYLASLAYLASRISIYFTVCGCLSVVCCSYFVASQECTSRTMDVVVWWAASVGLRCRPGPEWILDHLALLQMNVNDMFLKISACLMI